MKNWMRKINGVSDVLRGGLRKGILSGGRLRGGALLFMAGLVFASAYIFTGCSDDAAGGKSASEEKNGAQISGGSLASGGNVRGKLLIAGMASDGAVTSGAASRSATSSFNLDGKDSSKYRWVVNAYYKDKAEEFYYDEEKNTPLYQFLPSEYSTTYMQMGDDVSTRDPYGWIGGSVYFYMKNED